MAIPAGVGVGQFVPQLADTKLERNRSGFYSIKWTEPAWSTGTGRPQSRTHSCRTKDRRLAEEIRQAFIAAGQHIAQHTAAQTIGGMLDGYYQQHIEVEGKSTQFYEVQHLKAFMGHLDLGDLTSNLCVEYRADRQTKKTRRGTPVSDATIRRELGALRAAVGWMLKTDKWPQHLRVPYIPLPPDSKPRKHFLTSHEEEQLWALAEGEFNANKDKARARIALFIMLGLATAARTSAIEKLTWDRVNFGAGYIDYRDPSVTETKKRRAVVPIATRLLPILNEAWRRNKSRPEGKPPSRYVLGDPGSTRKGFQTFMKGAGLTGTWRHDLRRTWASLSVQAGVDIYSVANVLGDTVDTTEKHYGHLVPGKLVNAVNRKPTTVSH